jgi:hypothetical protein
MGRLRAEAPRLPVTSAAGFPVQALFLALPSYAHRFNVSAERVGWGCRPDR